jgi:hypothetical protein
VGNSVNLSKYAGESVVRLWVKKNSFFSNFKTVFSKVTSILTLHELPPVDKPKLLRFSINFD